MPRALRQPGRSGKFEVVSYRAGLFAGTEKRRESGEEKREFAELLLGRTGEILTKERHDAGVL